MGHLSTVPFVLACAGMAAPAFAAPPAATVLAPSSSWRLDYADDSCRLMRSFGEGESRTLLVMDRYSPGDNFALLVAGKPIESAPLRGGQPVPVKLTFGPTEAEQDLTAAPAEFDGLPAVVVSHSRLAPAQDDGAPNLWLPTITPQREAAIRTLTLAAPSRKTVVLELGPMGKPMAGLRTCVDQLITHWGMDAARYAARTADALPTGNPGTWVRPSDYPRSMVSLGNQSVVHFRLMVGTDGKPVSCHIQASGKPQEFDDAVCKAMMRRASFTPALDAAGQPFLSFFQSSVRFQIAN